MSYVSRNFTAKPGVQTAGAKSSHGISHSLYRRFGKRDLDLLLVVLTLPLILPLIGLMALAIRLEGGPAFYTQKRLGQNGRIFEILKLRTMVVDADRYLAEYLATNADAKAEWDHNQKLMNDPRVTRVGRFLRRTSLDELPQLLNVLKGDMSLVGPRPMTVEQGPLYPGTAYYKLRPGITGPWQVSDRHETSFAARATYDNSYAQSLSLKEDVSLLGKTVGVVLRCTGV